MPVTTQCIQCALDKGGGYEKINAQECRDIGLPLACFNRHGEGGPNFQDRVRIIDDLL